LLFIYALVSAIVLGLAFAPAATLIAANTLIGLWNLGNFIFKGLLVWHSESLSPGGDGGLNEAVRALREEDLPSFTVLVPMFREPEVLPILAHALRSLQYPRAKLDIKLVLEANDTPTIEAAKSLGLEGIFEIIRVPSSQPQTKPKACNYALRYARGDYVVVYDAEDKPEPDQLLKVVTAFRRAPANTACIQCRLNYYNARENWLTRMFTLD
jgi:cellulose synthase/poly-beta-1,6-N-acetylglucosamine synthase-like glycosyltransferase